MPPKKKEIIPEGKALELAIAAIEKKYGKGAVMYQSPESLPEIQWLSTGSAGLDYALGGGFARGRIVEVYGPPTGGKTTVALHTIAKSQAQGLTCAFIDMEHALDISYATALGVQVDKLLISQPGCGEEALDMAELLIRSKEVALIVVDSVAALVPRAELEGEIGDSHVGLQARLMSQALRKLAGVTSQTNTCLLFINQIRMKIGGYGNPETVAGGEALKFYASQRVDIRCGKTFGDGEKVGRLSTAKVVKSKVSKPFREVEIRINFGTGIDLAHDLVQILMARGILKKEGAAYGIGYERVGYGEESFLASIREDKELEARLRGLLVSDVAEVVQQNEAPL